MTDVRVGWQHPAVSSDGDLAAAAADGVATALAEIGIAEPDVEVVEQAGDELALDYLETRIGPSPWAEQVAYALATGSDHAVPETAAERWRQVDEAGEQTMRRYVSYWAWLACHLNATAFVAAAVPAYGALDEDMAGLVATVLHWVLVSSTAPLPDPQSLQRRVGDTPAPELSSGILAEQLCAEHSAPIRLGARQPVLAQIAADQRTVGGAFDYWLVERLDSLADLTPSTCFVVDDAVPEGWLVVRHGRRPLSFWPVPPAGCSVQSAPTPVRLHIPAAPDIDIYAVEGGTVIDYLADAVSLTTRLWAAEMASTRQTERVLTSLTATWDAFAVDRAREVLGVELLTHALRQWLNAGHPVTSAQVLVREMLANGHDSREQALEIGFAAAERVLAGPPDVPFIPPQRVSDEVPTAGT